MIRGTKIRCLNTIMAVIRKYKKKYCVASQAKLIELLEMHHGITIGLRMLNYHLADLRKAGWIKTIHRTHRNLDGTICLETSATCITPLGYWHLWKMGCEWAKGMYDSLMKKYFPKPVKKESPAGTLDEKEALRRLELGKKMFADTAFRKAFGLDEPPEIRRPNF